MVLTVLLKRHGSLIGFMQLPEKGLWAVSKTLGLAYDPCQPCNTWPTALLFVVMAYELLVGSSPP